MILDRFSLQNKTALVTGSTQGIGLSIARALAELGCRVYVHCSADSAKAERVSREIGGAGGFAADLSDPAAARALPLATGPVDILVTNASVQYRTALLEIGDAEFDTQVNVNLRSTLILMQGYAGEMKRRGNGRIITIGSVQQAAPHPDMAIYAATKCAVVSLVKNLAKQLAPYGVTVNNVAPGVIATPRNEAALSDPEYAKRVYASIPLGYAGEGDDVAGAVCLLASDAGRYITGADIPVSGGKELL